MNNQEIGNSDVAEIVEQTNGDEGQDEIKTKDPDEPTLPNSDEPTLPNSDEPTVTNTDEETKPSNNVDQWEDLLGSGSILKQVIKKGTPNTRPQRSQNCKVRYEISLLDGTVVQKEDELLLTLGDSEVVQGLDLAIGLMEVGEICKLKIESRLAYGERGLGSLIPSNATVQFEVELLEVSDEDEPETLTVDQRRIIGHRKRERGNWWYSRRENQLAIQCYRKALDYLDEVEGGIQIQTEDEDSNVTDAALQQLLEDRITVYNNMAAAQLKLELYDAALQSLQTVLHCQPNNVKALFRKAKIYKVKNDIPAALKILNKAKILSPNDKDIISEIGSLEKIREKQKKSEKDLARRMFGGINSDSKATKQTTKPSRLYVWATLGASVTVGLLGLIVYRIKYNL